MKIQSMADLTKIKDAAQPAVALRQGLPNAQVPIEILIGMATCGISSGAKETFDTFIEELKNQKIENVKVIPVGCIGSCHAEPTVQVNILGQEPVLYGNVKKDKVSEIVEKHLKEGHPVQNLQIKFNFQRA